MKLDVEAALSVLDAATRNETGIQMPIYTEALKTLLQALQDKVKLDEDNSDV